MNSYGNSTSFTPHRGIQRNTNLRQVGNGSSDTAYNSRHMGARPGPVQHDQAPEKLVVERRCVIWVHDESFAKEEVVLNLDLFPDVQPGELMAIVALKADSSMRDFQDKTHQANNEGDDSESSTKRERSNSLPKIPVGVNGTDGMHDVDLGNRYLFIAKDLPKEMKTKQPNLEVSVAKHIADVFCLKHRSNVLLTTVCYIINVLLSETNMLN